MSDDASRQPSVWVIISDKAGDNAQIDSVLSRLGWDVEYRRLIFKKPFIKGKPPFLASLYHVDHARSDRLEPPWPDMVFTIGRRPAMAAFWVRKRSGRKTRIVLFGRPKRGLENYALIVTPVQYALPDAANVLKIGLPLMRVDEKRVEDTKAKWEAHFAALSRPIIAVLVGGSTRPYVLDADGARDLLRQASSYLNGDPNGEGTLYVTTSRRTPRAAVKALEEELPRQGVLYKWSAAGEDNPYLALLASADGFVVTGDSMSMMTEVVRLKRPLAIYALPRSRLVEAAARLTPRFLARLPSLLKYRLMPRLGLAAFPRDLTRVHQWLYDHALAVPAGRPLVTPDATAKDDLDRVVAAIRSLA
jgi:mitochondrial fission protein ELM1